MRLKNIFLLIALTGSLAACHRDGDSSPIVYTVTFHANGGVLTGDSSFQVTTGTLLPLDSMPEVTREDFDFMGWFTATTGGTQWYRTDTIKSTRVLYARWQVRNFVQVGDLKFMKYNIGANPEYDTPQEQMAYVAAHQADNTDATVYGSLFQWGRIADGHERRTSTSIAYNAETIAYDSVYQVAAGDYYGKFIYGAYDWRGEKAHTNDFYNPCPVGWRVPTQGEWEALIANGNVEWEAVSGGYILMSLPRVAIYPPVPNLFLPAAGSRSYEEEAAAAIQQTGVQGCYWTTSLSGTMSAFLSFNPSADTKTVDYFNRAMGLAVRCVAE